MSTTAVITRNNRVVKINGVDQSNGQKSPYTLEDLKFDIDGALIGFKVNPKEFIFITKNNYFDVNKESGKEGFCLKSAYQKYKNRKYTIDRLLDDENWFDSHFQLAEKGDTFYILKIETDKEKTSNYTKYYIQTEYQFKIRNFEIDFFNSKQYPESNSNTERPESDNYSIVRDHSVDRLNQADGRLFKKNFGNKINTLDISDAAKKALYRGIINICFKSFWVVKDVLEILAIKDLQKIATFINTDSTDIVKDINESSYTKIDKTIAFLLLDLGFRDIGHTIELAPIYENDQYYNGLYQPFENYYNALVNFYENLYQINEQDFFLTPIVDPSNWPLPTLNLQSLKRMKFIKDIFPASAISLIFQFDEVKDIFDTYIENNFMMQHQEAIALKLLHSLYLNPKEGEKFLDYLLDKNDVVNTNFYRLYLLFDDEVGKNSLGMFSGIYDFFAREKSNRRNFVFAIFKIWEQSKYNFYYKGDGVLNEDGINLSSFFFTEKGKEYFKHDASFRARFLLEFGTVQTNTWENYEGIQGDKLVQDVNYFYKIRKELNGEKVKISKTTTYDHYIVSNLGSTYATSSKDYNGDTYDFELHLYQPIFMLGYKGNLELQPIISEFPYIPSFLLYYYEDFDRLRDLQAGISFAVDATFEVSLFFLSGGASAFSKIRYLKYFTEIGSAIRNGSTAANTALIITGVESVADTVTVLASVGGSYYSFMKNTAGTPALAKQYEETSQMFFNLTLYAGGASLVSRFAAGRFAKLAFEKPNFNTLPQDVQDLVKKIIGIDDTALNNFRTTKLVSKPKIATAYDSWLPSIRRKFYEEFKSLNEADLAKLDNEAVLINWKKLVDNNIDDRKFFSVISNNTKTNSIVRYYEQYRFRQKLASYEIDDRWWFLDRHGITDDAYFQKLIENPYALDLHLITRKRPLGAKHLMDDFQVKLFVRNNNHPVLTNYLYELQKPINWKQLKAEYVKKIRIQDLNPSELKDLDNRFKNLLTGNKQKQLFEGANRLYTKSLKIENNGVLIENVNTTNVNFISGKSKGINNILLNNNAVPIEFREKFINISNEQQRLAYEVFSDAAFDGINLKRRTNDTEIKFIEWFLTEQWSKGNKFTVELESVLYSCPSCQRHLMMLVEYGKINGKTINIKFIAHPGATTMNELKSITK